MVLGVQKFFDSKKVIPDDSSRALTEGAIKPWETKVFGYQKKFFIETINKILKQFKIKINTPWKVFPLKFKILYCTEIKETK